MSTTRTRASSPAGDASDAPASPVTRSATILVVDDEADIVRLLRHTLEQEGYTVLDAADGESALAAARTSPPDLIVLDRMMPGPDGVEVLRRLRRDNRTSQIPVILLTARTAVEDRVEGLHSGADDYVTKPFSSRELVARIRALLRRSPPAGSPPEFIRNGDLVIDAARREVTYRGRPIPLSPPEFRILQFLASSPGRVVFRRSRPQGELLLGMIARRMRLVSRQRILEAAELQDRDPGRRFGEILVDKCFLSPADLARVLEMQASAVQQLGEDAEGLLGRILVSRGLAAEFQVNEALRLQGRLIDLDMKPVPLLGEILVRRGTLAPSALVLGLQLQNFMLYRCPQCGAAVGFHAEPAREELRCPRCKAAIPLLFAKMADAMHRVLEEAARVHAGGLPGEVLAAAEVRDRHFGKYLLVNEIGRGGNGIVYRAWQKDLNRFVALKTLSARRSRDVDDEPTPFGGAEAVKRFYYEARAIAELDHPNIVPVYDYGIAADGLYYAMRLIEGVSLHRLLHGDAVDLEPTERAGPGSAGLGERAAADSDIERVSALLRGVEELPVPARAFRCNARLPLEAGLSLLRDIARAVGFAHTKGIYHRDLKPENILVDREGRPWVVDFGLAKVARLGDSAYRKNMILGTPHYMPPEQAMGDMEQVDEASDIYSLGAILYEIVSGIAPYDEAPSEAVVDVLLVRPPRSIEVIAPAAPEEVCRIVCRAMARHKQDRYGHAEAMAEDLERCIASIAKSS
jgi:DNA-binding response OmpR family regulator/serine/threonine protein kinase/DNA-directed RNA polymerase subunit RPC12/RpoP